MTIPHHDGEHHGHDHYAEADTHGQAMPHGHPHSALDEQHPGHNGHKHAGCQAPGFVEGRLSVDQAATACLSSS